jgi:hypothetical protein
MGKRMIMVVMTIILSLLPSPFVVMNLCYHYSGIYILGSSALISLVSVFLILKILNEINWALRFLIVFLFSLIIHQVIVPAIQTSDLAQAWMPSTCGQNTFLLKTTGKD